MFVPHISLFAYLSRNIRREKQNTNIRWAQWIGTRKTHIILFFYNQPSKFIVKAQWHSFAEVNDNACLCVWRVFPCIGSEQQIACIVDKLDGSCIRLKWLFWSALMSSTTTPRPINTNQACWSPGRQPSGERPHWGAQCDNSTAVYSSAIGHMPHEHALIKCDGRVNRQAGSIHWIFAPRHVILMD